MPQTTPRRLLTALHSETHEDVEVYVHPPAKPHYLCVDPEAGQPDLGLYEHHKGGRYRLLMMARYSETKDCLAIYISVDDGHGSIWARPVSMWSEEIRTAAGSVRPRFLAIEEDVLRVSISSNLASE